ncbi:hypothetical protein FHT44_006300 [Mycolicibacterium sp. BK634]|uniref:S8 family serine peptidase n=1 Tax=Mycolicibacterium sp. BK634 TaxID=2587099 RepID=UPI00161060F8|nr:S8 family serine peptidase [Mycolicibacterium sp. BK634]MBB3753778.1 hypothetical protein [Mycolicibacterium sp. BK634]
MADQSILLTVIPRAVHVVEDTLPISVLVSPRLTGAATLASFPDWLTWTDNLAQDGMTITVAAQGNPVELQIDPAPLRPALWSALFSEVTPVEDFTFDDYSDRTVLSYPARDAMLIVKTIYQRVARELGLPAAPGDRENAPRRTGTLARLLEGLRVDEFNDVQRRELRSIFGQRVGAPHARRRARGGAPVGADGLPSAAALRGMDADLLILKQQVGAEFTLYSRMPPGQPITKPDMATVLDFHTVISALNAYPPLLRALGLVFDLELPADVVPMTAPAGFGRLTVVGAETGWPTQADSTSIGQIADTAYRYQQSDDGRHYWLPASGPAGDRPTALGLLALNPEDFCLAQFDIDGAMHKLMMLASGFTAGAAHVSASLHPDKFDEALTVPGLRSIGVSLIHSGRARALLAGIAAAAKFNARLAGEIDDETPLFAEDLVRGYRIDIRDSFTGAWRSLHRRNGVYSFEGAQFESPDEEGFVQLGATQAVPGADAAGFDDLYLHEAIARWNGWSLSVPPPGKALSRHPDPHLAVPPDDVADREPDDRQNEPVTPFKMTTAFRVTPRTLPALRFGRRYRLRARVVDVAGNSLSLDDPLTDRLADRFALPPADDGLAYLRYEPIPAPQLVRRDDDAITGNGSTLDRLVIRTFNDDPSLDGAPPVLTGSDRHICPPRTSVEMAERHGMLDDASGRLKGDEATYRMLVDRDDEHGSQFPAAPVPGHDGDVPIVGAATIDELPYLPDPLARFAALRDLPGAPEYERGAISNDDLTYQGTDDPTPDPGSVTLIDFGTDPDWRANRPFLLRLAEGVRAPDWHSATRALTVYLPKGTTTTVPLSSGCSPQDLELSGIWRWLREYVADLAGTDTTPDAGRSGDWLTTALTRITEGGFWMLTPPALLTLVSAVQQPIGRPRFEALAVQRPDPSTILENIPLGNRWRNVNTTVYDSTGEQMATITAWRAPNALDASLVGALRVHGATTAKIDIFGEWAEWVDDPTLPGIPPGNPPQDPPILQPRSGFIDTLPLNDPATDRVLRVGGNRAVGIYNADQDLIGFTTAGDIFGRDAGLDPEQGAAPRHYFGNTKHYRVTYRAVATSRFREYFPQDLTFTRKSEAVTVDVPASARPALPEVRYAVPMFGWERQSAPNLVRSIRHGGGIRVYLERPWFSSGEGELLGVVLWQGGRASNKVREAWKSFITQWGRDPIWDTEPLYPPMPHASDFGLATVVESDIALPAAAAVAGEDAPAVVTVAGHPVAFDSERNLWFCDISIDTQSYGPLVRLALARYQPYALPEAKLSPIVLSDFVQLAPDRSVIVSSDPSYPRRIRLSVTGIAPDGPAAEAPGVAAVAPTSVRVRVQHRTAPHLDEFGWYDVDEDVAWAEAEPISTGSGASLWSGAVYFTQPPQADQFRLVIEEREHISADHTATSLADGATDPLTESTPGRVTFAEIVSLDPALTVRSAEQTGALSVPFPEADGADEVAAGEPEPDEPIIVSSLVLQVRDDVDIPYVDDAGQHIAAIVGDVWDALVATFPFLTVDRLFTAVPAEDLDTVFDTARAEFSAAGPALQRFFTVVCPREADTDIVVDALAALTDVFECVYVEDMPELPDVHHANDPHVVHQHYLSASPTGVDALYAWTQPGGDGSQVQIADVENNFHLDHEDLWDADISWITSPDLIPPDYQDRMKDLNHGTMSLGVLAMCDNTVGGVGIVPHAKVMITTGWYQLTDGTYKYELANTILTAASRLQAGDVLLVEWETAKTFLPVEVRPAVFRAIAEACGKGIIVIEPAGNGPENGAVGRYYDFETLVVSSTGQRSLRAFPEAADSGAIMVGACNTESGPPFPATNYTGRGARVNCFAPGNRVFTTLAQGQELMIQDGPGGPMVPNPFAGEHYKWFTGTSSASAIMAGVAASTQSMAKTILGWHFTPREMRAMLSAPQLGTASKTPATDRIGIMPDLRKIAALIRKFAAPGYLVAGKWTSVVTGHTLVPLGSQLVLDWVPDTREWDVWPYESLAISGDPLPAPAVRSGRWKTIGTGHTLMYMGGDLVLDYVSKTGDYRLFRADWRQPDFLPGPPITEGQWVSIRDQGQGNALRQHRLVYLGNDRVLDWVPQDRTFRIWLLDRDHTRTDPLLGIEIEQPDGSWDEEPLAEGSFPDDEMDSNTEILAIDTHQILVWHRLSGTYQCWNYNAAAAATFTRAARSGTWTNIQSGDVIAWLGDFGNGQLLHWKPPTGDYRLFRGVPTDA